MASVVCHFERGEKSFLFLHAEKSNLAKCAPGPQRTLNIEP